MNDRALRMVMAVLTLATVGIAGYLLQAHYSGGSVVCATGGCEAVERSRYSEIFGVPVSLFGLIGSAAILSHARPPRHPRTRGRPRALP